MIYPLFPQIHQKYKFMEGSLASRRRKLKSQVESWTSRSSIIFNYCWMFSRSLTLRAASQWSLSWEKRRRFVLDSQICFQILLVLTEHCSGWGDNGDTVPPIRAGLCQGKGDFFTQYNMKLILSSSSCFQVPPTDKVCLWLGANVMLEYTLDDAEVLLKKNCEQVVHSIIPWVRNWLWYFLISSKFYYGKHS